MPLIRIDYAPDHFDNAQLAKLNDSVFAASAKLCNLSEEDAQHKISIFSTPYGPHDHSTASAEIEVRAKKTEFEKPDKTPEAVRSEWLRHYESTLVPLAQQLGLTAPIIFTVTIEDWQVVVVSASGSVPN